jgi:hypothetical protein
MASKSRGSHKPLRWEELSNSQQLESLVAIWHRRAAEFRREYPNVLSVGMGYKTTNGERLPKYCLAFLVDRKTDAGRQVPSFVRTFVDHQGSRRAVDVPTDVDALGDGELQQGVNAADGMVVASASNPALRKSGAVCCLARLQGHPDLFVLSCHHVLTLSPMVGGCRVVGDATVTTPNSVPFAKLFDFFPLRSGPPSQVDAAIALVAPGQEVRWEHSGVRPSRVNMGQVEPPKECTVLAPRGRFIGARYDKTYPDTQIPYPGCGMVRIDCYLFHTRTEGGDSGSPIVSADGALQAMHIFGDFKGTYSLAIPAGYLFRPGVFRSGVLELA